MSEKLIIIGAGGMGVEALWTAQAMNAAGTGDWEILGFADDNPELLGSTVFDHRVLATSLDVLELSPCHFHCALGNNALRETLACALEARGFTGARLVHPSATIAESAVIGEGTYIGAGSIVMPLSFIGRHVILNILATASHHCRIEDYAQVCPGARINGACSVHTHAFLGTNAVLHPGVTVGHHARVGANSFVNKDVEPLLTVHGNPARPFFKLKNEPSINHPITQIITPDHD